MPASSFGAHWRFRKHGKSLSPLMLASQRGGRRFAALDSPPPRRSKKKKIYHRRKKTRSNSAPFYIHTCTYCLHSLWPHDHDKTREAEQLGFRLHARPFPSRSGGRSCLRQRVRHVQFASMRYFMRLAMLVD